MVRRWEDDWMHDGLTIKPAFVALARLDENDEIKALIQFQGTTQRHFYTVSRFEKGVRTEVDGKFPSVEEAKAAAYLV